MHKDFLGLWILENCFYLSTKGTKNKKCIAVFFINNNTRANCSSSTEIIFFEMQ